MLLKKLQYGIPTKMLQYKIHCDSMFPRASVYICNILITFQHSVSALTVQMRHIRIFFWKYIRQLNMLTCNNGSILAKGNERKTLIRTYEQVISRSLLIQYF